MELSLTRFASEDMHPAACAATDHDVSSVDRFSASFSAMALRSSSLILPWLIHPFTCSRAAWEPELAGDLPVENNGWCQTAGTEASRRHQRKLARRRLFRPGSYRVFSSMDSRIVSAALDVQAVPMQTTQVCSPLGLREKKL